MNVIKFLKRSDTIVGLVRDLRKAKRIPHLILRPFIIRKYLISNDIKKLQIGSGSSSQQNWLCTDLAPEFGKNIYLDVTKRFPFNDNTFDYVFAEHLIEHVIYVQGVFMLNECHRILKPGGIFRCATPDLKALFRLLNENQGDTEKKYVQWISERFFPEVKLSHEIFVINHAFKAWGHQFLYDSLLLEATMKETGFINITRQKYGESRDRNLTCLEMHGKNMRNTEMVEYETIIYEGMVSKDI